MYGAHVIKQPLPKDFIFSDCSCIFVQPLFAVCSLYIYVGGLVPHGWVCVFILVMELYAEKYVILLQGQMETIFLLHLL